MIQNLIDFNLEIALSEPERVVYRNGQKPLEWHYFKKNSGSWPIISIIPRGLMYWHNNVGAFSIKEESEWDLMLLPKTRKVWVVSCYRPTAFLCSAFTDKDSAILCISNLGKDNLKAYITEVEVPY